VQGGQEQARVEEERLVERAQREPSQVQDERDGEQDGGGNGGDGDLLGSGEAKSRGPRSRPGSDSAPVSPQ